MLALDLIFTDSTICLRDFSGIYEAQETDALQKHKEISYSLEVYKYDFRHRVVE